MSGTEIIKNWNTFSDAIYQSPMTWDLGVEMNQVFIDGNMIMEAQWPPVPQKVDLFRPNARSKVGTPIPPKPKLVAGSNILYSITISDPKIFSSTFRTLISTEAGPEKWQDAILLSTCQLATTGGMLPPISGASRLEN